MKRCALSLVILVGSVGSVSGAGTLTVSAPGYSPHRNGEYTTSHVYVDEVAGVAPVMVFRFSPGVGEVTDVELFTNLNRRDLAQRDRDGDGYPDGVVPVNGNLITDASEDVDPVSGHYFAPLNMAELGGGVWEVAVPVSKTGAYRVTARFKTAGQPGEWQWYGLRDHCVVAAPVDSREVRLYEINVFNIEASGDTFAERSTLEDLHDAPGAPHAATNRWNLGYLNHLGCNWLWFQPIHPNGVDGREVNPATGNPYDPGSPYAVKNFFEVNPLMTASFNGSLPNAMQHPTNRQAAMSAWQSFVQSADEQAVGIMLDAPFNHTAFDVELAEKGVALFQRDGETWSPLDEIRNRDARFFSRQGNYAERAYDASSIAAGPDRFDFGKWNDVKDVYFGRYDALVEYDAEPERSSYQNEGDWFDGGRYEWTNGDFVQGGRSWNVTRRVWEYFAHYAVHWLEKTRPAGQNRNSTPGDGDRETRYQWDRRGIDGLRCDFGQGLPPQCWEYVINVARSYKWNFVMMSESLDGGAVTYRSARHFDVLNENIVFPLKSAGDANAYRQIFEGRRGAYGQAMVLMNTTSHDEEVMADPWQSVVRYLVCATMDGVSMVFPGQELGISTTFGYQHYETNFGKQIPHFKRWNSMMPVWSDTNFGNDQLYAVIAAANRARAASPALRSSNRWFLDGDGLTPSIHAVAKYESAGVSPAFQDVVLAFSNLNRDATVSDQFKVPGALAGLLGLKDGRRYNVRNVGAYTVVDSARNQAWLWGAGYTGADLKNQGVFVQLPRVPLTNGDWAAQPFEGQYLKLYDVTPPPAPQPLAEAVQLGDVVRFDWVSPAGEDDHVVGWRFELLGEGGEVVETGILDVADLRVEMDVVPGVYRARLWSISVAGVESVVAGQSEAVRLLADGDDEDGDGMSNGDEVVAGTNPLVAGSVLRVGRVEVDGGGVVLRFDAVPGRIYQVEASADLEAGSWEEVGVALVAEAVEAAIRLEGEVLGGKRFFRIRVSGG